MLPPRIFPSIFPIGFIVLGASIASAQDYPTKPVRLVTSEVGAGNDFVARVIAQGVSTTFGQRVIVENRGGGILSVETVLKAAPDGYTFLLAGGSFTTGPLLRKMAYDPLKDFAPVSLTNRAPNILVVHPSLPVRSVKELISLAKAKPGALNYSAGLPGTTSHLAAELFNAMAGINVVRIHYKGTSLSVNDLISGQVQLTFGSPSLVAAHVSAGKLRALAVTSPQPSAMFPALPTVSASGLPGYESGPVYTVLAPARTPIAIIDRINQEIVRFLKTQEAKDKFLAAGIETVGSSPQELGATLKLEMTRLGKVIRDAGIREESVN